VAIDQLRRSGSIGDATMSELTSYHGVHGVLDLIATGAFYRMAAWLLNACRTPLDDGQPPPAIAGVERADLPIAAGGPAEPGTSNVGIDQVPLERWPADLVDRTATWPRFAGRPEIRQAGVYGTLANHPPLFIALGPIMAHLLIDNTLTDRQREIVIVRSCLLDRGAYPYRQHVGIAAAAGVDQRSLDELTEPEPTLDDPVSSAIVAAVDDLHRLDDITDATWAELVRHVEPEQIMDIVATAGFYGLISFVLNSARTPLESGTVVLPPTPLPKGPT
jgi:alkylhydroperoxidase family enzyme